MITTLLLLAAAVYVLWIVLFIIRDKWSGRALNVLAILIFIVGVIVAIYTTSLRHP